MTSATAPTARPALSAIAAGRRTRIKICGLTREADIDTAVQEGADALGFVFFEASRRYVSPDQAAQLRRRIPAFVDVVALFVNADAALIREVQDKVAPELLQFHGDETPEACQRHHQRFLRAFRIGGPALPDAAAVAATCQHWEAASAWLFDSDSRGYGGSGHGFDHSLLDAVITLPAARPVILAGGLNPGNVSQAIARTRPWAVDVSSGVESAPGEKSAASIQAFCQAVRAADSLTD